MGGRQQVGGRLDHRPGRPHFRAVTSRAMARRSPPPRGGGPLGLLGERRCLALTSREKEHGTTGCDGTLQVRLRPCRPWAWHLPKDAPAGGRRPGRSRVAGYRISYPTDHASAENLNEHGRLLVRAAYSKTVSGEFPPTKVRIPPPPFSLEIGLVCRGTGPACLLGGPSASASTDVHERRSNSPVMRSSAWLVLSRRGARAAPGDPRA